MIPQFHELTTPSFLHQTPRLSSLHEWTHLPRLSRRSLGRPVDAPCQHSNHNDRPLAQRPETPTDPEEAAASHYQPFHSTPGLRYPLLQARY
jgi:hypothetical protein